MRQRQRLHKKFFFDFGPACDSRRSIGAREDSHHRNHDNTHKRMLDIDGGSRVLQFVKVIDNVLNADTFDSRHEPTPGSLEIDTIPKTGVGKNRPWRKSCQAARITQSSRWPCYLAGLYELDELGLQLRRQAAQVGMDRADQWIGLSDGGNGL